MANIALYRKYRSRTFTELIGQDHVTEPLIAALRNGRLNHAYLFSGPRGCGKTSSARILARSVNCAKGPTPEPCGECESCRALASDGPGSIDVIEIDAASHGGVDDARELREKAFFAPVNSKFKVYVIDEAHMVSSAGFNALLKLVEEPPEYVMFVFATTEPDKVLGTIKSRTHHYPFRLVPPGVMRTHLERVCDSEGVKVDPAVFPLVVRAGGGSVRDSMSVLDQLLAGAGDDGVGYHQAMALLGVTDIGLIDEACDALASADGAALFRTVDRVVEAGHDPRRFAADLLERLRDLIVLNQVPDALSTGLLEVPPDESEHLTGQALRLGAGTLARMADILHDGLAAMRGATSPRLVLELLCARMLLPGDESTADLLHRMERLERRLELAGSVPSAPTAPHPQAPHPQAQAVRPAAPEPRSAPPAAPAQPAIATAHPTGPAPATDLAVRSVEPTPHIPEPHDGPVRHSAETHAPSGSAPSGAAPSGQAPESHRAPDPSAAARHPDVPAAAPGPQVDVRLMSPRVSSGVLDVAAVSQAWPQVLEAIKRRSRSPRVVGVVRSASVVEVEADTIVLSVPSAFHAREMANPATEQTVAGGVAEVLGEGWKVRTELVGPGGSRGSQPRSEPAQSLPAQPQSATLQPQSAQPQSAQPQSAQPQSAQPQSAQPQRSAAAASTASAAPEQGGWPETARPGGAVPTAGPDPSGPDPSGPGTNSNSTPGGGQSGSYGGGQGAGSHGGVAGGGATAGVATARPETMQHRAPGPQQRVGGSAPRAATAPGTVTTAERPTAPMVSTVDGLPDGPTDFSPDDPVPANLGSYDGFAPGDEPSDEPLDPAAAPPPPRSVEDQALSLLEAMGAEKID